MNELQESNDMNNQKKEIFEQLKEQQQAVREDRAAEIIDLQIAFDPRQSQVSCSPGYLRAFTVTKFTS